MNRTSDKKVTHGQELAHDGAPAQPELAEGALGKPIPETTCRLCWHERLVWRAGVWTLEHRGPLSACTHHCHDTEQLLPSVS